MLTPTLARSDELAAACPSPRAGACEARTTLESEQVLLRHQTRGTMHRIREQSLRQSRVTAVFEDHTLSFLLAKDATLEELSDRLADLDRQHRGWPVAITVKFSSRNAGSHRIRRPAGVSGCVNA